MSSLPKEVLEAALAAAVSAAKRAGFILEEFYKKRYDRDEQEALGLVTTQSVTDEASLDIAEKSAETDLVTAYDKACDDLITKALSEFNAQYTGSHTFCFITEELAPEGPLTDAPTWIVDPIDGTMSFVHKSFDCCISIGLSVNKRPVLGVIYCPFLGRHGELYTAVEGRGAHMNGKPIHVSLCRKPTNAVVFFNMPWRMARKAIEASVGIRTELAADRVRAIRSYGAAVLQLAQLACGRADLYMEPGGKLWDICAGAIMIQEAGGVMRNIDGSPFTLESHNVTCGSSTELVEYGAALCRKYDLLNAYFHPDA